MPGTLVGELIAMLEDLAVRAVIAGPVREWRLSSFYEKLSREHKMAFLEVGCAAILHDGAVSESEEAWLERRKAASDSDAELVDADKQREWVYTTAQILLRACSAQPAASKLFAEALGLSPEGSAVVDSRLQQGLK